MRTIREALLSMGYKEVAAKKWMKPIGWQCFTYNEENNMWGNWFVSASKETLLWERRHFNVNADNEYDYLAELKDFETYTKHGLAFPSSFELAVIDIRMWL